MILHYLIRYRSKVIKENLTLSFPNKSAADIKQLQHAFYKNLCDVTLESIKLFSITPAALQKRVSFENIDYPESYLKNGSGIIVLTSHLCNWEWLLQACALYTNFTIDGVYKEAHNASADKMIYNLRSRFGAHPVEMKDVMKHLIKTRKETRVLAMVADQTPPHAEIQYWQTFLHQYTPFYVGGDKIGAMMQRPVFFASMKRTQRGHYHVTFDLLMEPPIPKEEHSVTEKYVALLEQKINESPSDWLWSHKRWKHKVIKTKKSTTTFKE